MVSKNTALSLAVLVGWFVIMYVANTWMPLYRDDYLAAVIWRTGDHLASMGDVFYSLERYYYMHGGRLVSFFIQFVFMLWGKVYFNVANALVFTLLLPVMLMHCRRDFGWYKEPSTLLLLGCCAWLGLSHFGEVVIWLCGSAVYLWTGFLTAVFLLPYNLAMAENFRNKSYWLAIFMLPFGMIAACSVENLTVTTTLLVMGITVLAYRRGLMALWMITGMIGSIIGSIVCILAPGNFVRIVEDQDRSWLFHILNQIPSNLDMIMYLLPVILALILAGRILKGENVANKINSGKSIYVAVFILMLSIVSFFTTGFFAQGLRNLIVAWVLSPLGLTDDVTISHFDNTMAGFEEAFIYILGVVIVYQFSVRSLGLDKKSSQLSWRELWGKYASVRYGLGLIVLAFLNNFLVMGAPSFPGRALFSSSIIFIMGGAVILREPVVWDKMFIASAGRIFRGGGLAITAFIIIGTLTVLHSIWQEDAIRVAYIAEQARDGQQRILVPPSDIPEQRRILRHIAYDDFDTGMTREHICYYFGIGTVELDPTMSIEDIWIQ